MQELGEVLVSVLDSLSIEYVVGLGEGAGANILARWGGTEGTHCPYHCNFRSPGSGWRTRQDVWASF